MTIVILGDIHGSLNYLKRLVSKIKHAEALFVTGDITGTVSYPLILKSILETKAISREKYTDLVYGKYRDRFVRFQIKSAIKFLKLVKKLECPVFFTHGNSEAEEVRDFFTAESKDNENLHFLHNEIALYDDWLIMGYGYCSPATYRKALQTPGEKKNEHIIGELQTLENEIMQKYTKPDLLKFALIHEPPFNTVADYLPFQNKHGGSKTILSHIDRIKYDYVFAGHIHESQGYETRKGSVIINPGALVDARWASLELNENIAQTHKLPSLFNLKSAIYNTRNHFK